MYKKIQSLEEIARLGLNMHKYYIPKTYAEFLEILTDLRHCTIRTDHSTQSDDLPFFIIDIHHDSLGKLRNLWNMMDLFDYKAIISDGIKFDSIQNYNMVIKLQKNGDFIFEASELKVPLRHMYRHPMLSCRGHVSDDVQEWIIINQRYGINKLLLRKDIQELYTRGIFNKWLEVTKYPQNVGVKKERMVFWEIRN